MKEDNIILKKNNEDILEENTQKSKFTYEKYKQLLNAIPNMAWYTDLKSNYCEVNNKFVLFCEKELSDIIGKNHEEVWGVKIGSKFRENDLKVIKTKKDLICDEIIPNLLEYKCFKIHRTPIKNENGKVIGIISVASDGTVIRNCNEKFKELIESIPFRIWSYDKDGIYINANAKFAISKEIALKELIGRNFREFYNKEEINSIVNENNQVYLLKRTIKFTKEIIEKNKKRIVEVYKTPILGNENEVIGIVGAMVDITKIKNTEEKIRKQAYTDSHTGVLNRRALYEYIDNISKCKNFTIFIIDVDNFKYINDNYGHHLGDAVLLNIANKLKELCSDGNIFRFGGDEFIVALENVKDKEEIERRSKKIINEIHKITINENINEKVSISMGSATCKCNSKKCTEGSCKLITKADIALYKAKECGKNKYVIYTKGLEQERILRFNIETDLKKAVEKNEIKLFYQPQYTQNNELIGFEALFRWDNKKYFNIPVIKIINIMEESNLIISIGNEIMKQACMFSKKINENREKILTVFFNVSSVQIMDDNFIKYIKKILKETKVNTKCIGIEITESVFLENTNENIKKITKLKKLGINITLDDFGTGYSSLNYLVKLPLSQIKIDRSFILGIEEGEEYKNLVKLIVDSSHALNLYVVAEGIEKKNQLTVLSKMGVDYIQGYLFSKPLEENKALDLINENNLKVR